MQSAKISAIIVAAGSGSRFGSEVPKQFLTLNGVEVLSMSVHAFRSHPDIHKVIIVTSQKFLDSVTSRYPDCQVVAGGETRQDSVFNGLNACDDDTEIVLVHDAARPIIPKHIIDACLAKLMDFDGVAPAVKPVDSMILMEENGFRNLNREHLRIVQTPQCFRMEILRQAHDSGLVDTDELGLVRRACPEARLTLVEGDSKSMKITSSHDLVALERHLPSTERGQR